MPRHLDDMVSCGRVADEIRKMGILGGVLYETVVSTYGEGYAPHASAMGTIFEPLGDSCIIRLKPHRSSITYSNLSERGEGVINIVGPELLVECALDLGVMELLYEKAEEVDAPRLSGAASWIEFRVREVRLEGEWGQLLCSPVSCGYRSSPPAPYTRAGPALVEAAVHASRIDVYRRLGAEAKVRELMEETERHLKLAERLAPGTSIEEMARLIRRRFIA